MRVTIFDDNLLSTHTPTPNKEYNGTIYFRIPFTMYFVASIKLSNKKFFVLARKSFNAPTAEYYWKMV